jgi:hypothetical protein
MNSITWTILDDVYNNQIAEASQVHFKSSIQFYITHMDPERRAQIELGINSQFQLQPPLDLSSLIYADIQSWYVAICAPIQNVEEENNSATPFSSMMDSGNLNSDGGTEPITEDGSNSPSTVSN